MLDTSNSHRDGTCHPAEPTGRVQPPSSDGVDSENGSGKLNTGHEGGVSVRPAPPAGTPTHTRAREAPVLVADDDDGVNV
jgi:hypothetical protein